MTTLGELITDPAFICSTNVERALFELLVKCGVIETASDGSIATNEFDERVGDAKERIYNEFAKMLGFEYFHQSYYHVKGVGEDKIKKQ